MVKQASGGPGESAAHYDASAAEVAPTFWISVQGLLASVVRVSKFRTIEQEGGGAWRQHVSRRSMSGGRMPMQLAAIVAKASRTHPTINDGFWIKTDGSTVQFVPMSWPWLSHLEARTARQQPDKSPR